MYREYFAGTNLPSEVVGQQWVACAKHLDLRPELLRPTDRFRLELRSAGHADQFDGRLEDLEFYALGHLREHGSTMDIASVRTLGELVCALATADRKK